MEKLIREIAQEFYSLGCRSGQEVLKEEQEHGINGRIVQSEIVNKRASVHLDNVVKKYIGMARQSPAPKSQSEWRPIETAPKKASVNFLAFELGVGVHITSWWPEHDGGRGGYRTPHHGWRPTHWMPMPENPEIAEGGK